MPNPTEPPTTTQDTPFRFGMRYVIAYTALCCGGFAIQSALNKASRGRVSLSDNLLSIIVVMSLLLGVAIVGLGPSAVRISFQVVGKMCVSFFVGGIAAIFFTAYAASHGTNEKWLLPLLAAIWIAGFLISTLIAFRQSLRQFFK